MKYEYNASGLVTKIQYNSKLKVEFLYNDKGFRVQKKTYATDGISVEKTTHYVRDASGSTLAIYENNQQVEMPIYGGSRLGIYKKPSNTSVYQLTDHLGNVRAVIVKDGNDNAAALVSATDYYPFGMPMPGRQIVGGEPYRYAYQGQELDPETGKVAFQLRLYDPRINRWLTTDPKGEFHSPYLAMGNNPINLIDPDGGSTASPPTDFINKETGQHVKVNDNIDQIILVDNKDWGLVANYQSSFAAGGGISGLSAFSNYTPILPNSFGLYQFPESGKGFARYTDYNGNNNGNNENYTVNGTKHTTDNWASLNTFKSLYKTFAEFNSQTGTTIHYGDISAFNPSINLGHKTHFTGNSVDIHYFDSKGTELRGNGAYRAADIKLTNLFFQTAQNNGFLKNYSFGNRFNHTGNTNHSVHKNHLHIGF